MNKLMAILLGVGALGAFGLSQREGFESQQVDRYGSPSGEATAHYSSRSEKIGFIVFGGIFMIGSLYFISRVRHDDLRGK